MTQALHWLAAQAVVVEAGAAVLALLAVILAVWALLVAAAAGRRRRRAPRAVVPAGDGVAEALGVLQQQLQDLEHRMGTLENRQALALSRVGMVRFNPFADTGADLSFAVALLNAGGDGLVLTGLWGRDEVRVYAKPVEGAQSRYALSEEERAAIDLAMRDRRQASP
ncbi:conserved protein of unknown function [Candidatus Hydrogenisulfobacillus filiaventi]|uniref:DUF4446 domain-containing protein n=1 Tax=Candidatus Hydrogenisulfobacillus filiaventi TaxID=2707344 RepID=A0A6F8ZKH8_9FIRM|nr:conserved protein of unknown function [Candidatus Hydrogenisulfobacillus filiaventi]